VAFFLGRGRDINNAKEETAAPRMNSRPYPRATNTTTPRLVAITMPILLSVPTTPYDVARRSDEVALLINKVRPIITSAVETEARVIPIMMVAGLGASA